MLGGEAELCFARVLLEMAVHGGFGDGVARDAVEAPAPARRAVHEADAGKDRCVICRVALADMVA